MRGVRVSGDRGQASGDGKGYSLLQQNDISQHPEHLVEPGSLVHTPDDGIGQLSDGVLGVGPGDAMVAMF